MYDLHPNKVNCIFSNNTSPVHNKNQAKHILTHNNLEKDGTITKSSCKVHLCESDNEHIELLQNCFKNQIHFTTDSLQPAEGLYNINKFHQSWKLVNAFEAINAFKNFLKNIGDNKELPYLFASIFFNCHTQETIDFIVNSVGSNTNLQKRHPVFFAYDLITGWIPENLLEKPFNLVKCGCDSDYKLQKGKNINSSQDFILGNQKIELAVNYTNIIQHKDKFHLRYKKWQKIQQPNSHLLILSTRPWTYYFYPSEIYSKKINAEYKERIESWSSAKKSVSGYELSGWKNLPALDLTKVNLSNSFANIQ